MATESLPSEKECLEMAYQFSLDIEPEKIITKEEENTNLYLNEGDVLPTEILFYEEHILKLIQFCQGKITTEQNKQIENFRQIFKSIVYQNSEIASSNARLKQLHAWDKNGSHDKAILKELETRKALKEKLTTMLKGKEYEDWKIFSAKLSAVSSRLKRAIAQEEKARMEMNNLKFTDFII